LSDEHFGAWTALSSVMGIALVLTFARPIASSADMGVICTLAPMRLLVITALIGTRTTMATADG
jgi:hypothetical protein